MDEDNFKHVLTLKTLRRFALWVSIFQTLEITFLTKLSKCQLKYLYIYVFLVFWGFLVSVFTLPLLTDLYSLILYFPKATISVYWKWSCIINKSVLLGM